MKTIMITGASGLVGRAVIEKLKNEPDVTVYVAAINYYDLKMQYDNVTILSNEQAEEIMSREKIDVLLQLAFPRNVDETRWAGGIRYAIDILFHAKRCGVKRIINVSSQSIYGLQRESSANESHELHLFSPYTTGKFCTEAVAADLFESGSYTNIRLSTIISPTTSERVPNKLFAQIVNGNDLIIKGGKQQFAFLDVRDAAEGLVVLMKRDDIPWKEAYNLGTAAVNSLLDIASLCVTIGKEHGFTDTKIIVNPEDAYLKNQIDVGLFEQDFGWKASIGLEESLRNIFEESFALSRE